MRIRLIFAAAAAAAVSAAAALPIAEVTRESPVDFGRDVHPILKRNCLACHNASSAKAGLNLESPAAMIEGGDNGPAVVAGRSGESLMLKTAAHLEDPVMPPAGNKVKAVDLTPEELGLLKLWIDQGATGGAGTAATPIVWRRLAERVVPVSAVAVSPGGVVVAAARGNQVELTELATGQSLGLLDDPLLAKDEVYGGRPVADRDVIMSVAFGSDDLLATGGYRSVRIWRRSALRPSMESLVMEAPATALATAGTMAVAGDAGGRVRVWDASAAMPTAIELKDEAEPSTAVTTVALSPDVRFAVAAADDRRVRVWSLADRRVVYHATSPVPLHSLVFAEGGKRLVAAGADGVLRVYAFSPDSPAATPVPEREMRLADRAPAVLCSLGPAGTHILWGDGSASLQVVDVATGETVRQVVCEPPGARIKAEAERQVEAARRHADGRQARAAAAAEAAKKENEAARAAHELMEKTRAEWHRKQTAATTAAESLRVRPDEASRQELASKSSQEDQAAGRAYLNARTNAELGVRLAGDAAHRLVAAEAAHVAAATALAEAQTRVPVAPPAASFPAIHSAAVLSDGRTLVAAVEGGWAQWHCLESGALLDRAEWTAPPSVLAATSGVDGAERLLAIQGDKKSVVLPARRPWQHQRTLGSVDDPTVFGDRVTALAFSSDARLLATGGGIPSRGGEVNVWHVESGTMALALKDPHSDTVNAVAFSPDDAMLATAGSDRWARVFRLADGKTVAAMEGHAAHVMGVDWRSDGLVLATSGADKSVRTWDVLEARQIANNTSFGKEVIAVRWLGTGDVVASASGDATVRLNDDRLPGASGFAFSLATDRLGHWVAAGGEDGMVRVWRAGDKSLAREIQALPGAAH